MMFVVPRQRRDLLGRPSRLIVNISSRPSRSDDDALGRFNSSHDAYSSICAIPSLASSFQAARNVALACSC